MWFVDWFGCAGQFVIVADYLASVESSVNKAACTEGGSSYNKTDHIDIIKIHWNKEKISYRIRLSSSIDQMDNSRLDRRCLVHPVGSGIEDRNHSILRV